MNPKEIKLPKPLSLEQKTEHSLNYYEFIKPHIQSNWSEELMKLCQPITEVEFPQGYEEVIFEGNMSEELVEKLTKNLLDAGIDLKNKKYFFKLFSRSSKDSSFITPNNVRDLIYQMAQSMRMLEDFVMYRYINQSDFKLVFKEFVNMDKSKEWRVLVKDNKIKVISQYFYEDLFVYQPSYLREVVTFVDKSILLLNKELGLKDYVADFYINGDKSILLETNPYGLSDPCLAKTYEQVDKLDRKLLVNTQR